MYENYNYDQFKALQDEEKKKALEELLPIFNNDTKELANYWGVPPIVTSNLNKRLIQGEHIGRKKEEVNQPIEAKTKRKYTRKQEVNEPVEIVHTEPIIINKSSIVSTNSLEGTIAGSESKQRLIGLANSLLDGKQYKLVIKIEELSL